MTKILRHVTRLAALLVLSAGLASASGCSGCDEQAAKDAPETRAKTDQERPSPEVPAEMAENRQAFGLPFPPDVLEVIRTKTDVRVTTRLTLDEVRDFFEARLVDFELIDEGRKLRVIGLRDYMPEIVAYQSGKIVRLHYRSAPERPKIAGAEAGADGQASVDHPPETTERKFTRTDQKLPSERRPGDPVTDRTADGQLVAPGARWGEPYTPPQGSPLHTKRNRPNFGRPYGQWQTF